MPRKKTIKLNKNNLEIISLKGTINHNTCHLQISFSDENCNVWAGHLNEGTITLKATDILIRFINENLIKEEKITQKKQKYLEFIIAHVHQGLFKC